jgi:hypothetical protein
MTIVCKECGSELQGVVMPVRYDRDFQIAVSACPCSCEPSKEDLAYEYERGFDDGYIEARNIYERDEYKG